MQSPRSPAAGFRSTSGRRQRDWVAIAALISILFLLFFIGLGVFNAVTTWIEEIVRPRVFPSQAGIVGGLMVLGGIAFIIGMDALKSPATGSMTTSLLILIALMVVCIILVTRLHESDLIRNEDDSSAQEWQKARGSKRARVQEYTSLSQLVIWYPPGKSREAGNLA